MIFLAALQLCNWAHLEYTVLSAALCDRHQVIGETSLMPFT